MNDNFHKYFVLMWLLVASVFGIAALVAVIFFVLKFFAISVSFIPGSGYVFEFFITTVPFFILFAAYYLVHKKISSSKTSTASVTSRTLLTIGSLICVAQLSVAILSFFNIKTNWLDTYEAYNKAWFALHLILILIAAGILATGDPKEKSWLDRKTNH
jgi:hypothetical protein